jgi:hypothetical protein
VTAKAARGSCPSASSCPAFVYGSQRQGLGSPVRPYCPTASCALFSMDLYKRFTYLLAEHIWFPLQTLWPNTMGSTAWKLQLPLANSPYIRSGLFDFVNAVLVLYCRSRIGKNKCTTESRQRILPMGMGNRNV